MASDFESEYYRSSEEYIDGIDTSILKDIRDSIRRLRKRKYQTQINQDLIWLLTDRGWSTPSFPGTEECPFPDHPPDDIGSIKINKDAIEAMKNPDIYKVTTTLNLKWKSDFGKLFGKRRVLIEVQLGKIEAAVRDFCRFAITYRERRLALGILIVMTNPKEYFSDRLRAISGMADFDTVRATLLSLNLECPVWLIGLRTPDD